MRLRAINLTAIMTFFGDVGKKEAARKRKMRLGFFSLPQFLLIAINLSLLIGC